MMPEESARGRSGRSARRAARRKRIIIWISILLVAILVVVAARPIYRGLKSRRANRLAAEAEEFVRDGKFNDAAKKYRAALQLDPTGYQPLAGAARLATRAARPEATDLWQEVLRLPESTTADRQDYAALLVQRGANGPAEKIITELLQTAPDSKTLRLASQFSVANGNETKALEFARLVVSRSPGDDSARFQLAELLAKSSEASQHEEAREILWSLADKEGPPKLGALEALARAPELSRDEQERVLNALEKFPQPRAITGLLAAELKLKMQPESAERIYDETVARWATGEDGDLTELTRWLNLHREAERVLTLLPVEKAVASEPLLLSRLDALANLKRWDEIDALLAQPNLALDPSVLESFRARNSLGQGSALDADSHWNHALALAGGDAQKLRFVASFAEQSGATAIAVKALEQLARFPDHAAFAQRTKMRLLDQTGDAVAAKNAAERLLAVAPNDTSAQAQLTHSNLLLGLEIDENAAKARELAAKFSTRLSYRVTAALGFLRQHNAAAALAQFDGPDIEWQKTPPSWRAIYAAALLANEKLEEAHKIMATIPRERLNKEERELIDGH